MRFDELCVVSDLHLGGQKGRQIFMGSVELVGLIELLTERPKDRRVGFVINGDFVDFLAEEPHRYLDASHGVEKLEDVLRRPPFDAVFAALRRFVTRANRHLVINLGNHDLELSLPPVREFLVEWLSQGKDAPRGRVHLELDGAGWRADVGQASVLCLHGNEVDTWNVTDYEQLRRVGRDLQSGHSPKPFVPNAGTKMVIDVMNDIKKRLPFVDLLKPEGEAVVPLLTMLDDDVWSRLEDVVGVAARLSWDKVRRVSGFLSSSDTANGQSLPFDAVSDSTRRTEFARILRAGLGRPPNDKEDLATSLIVAAEAQRRASVEPIDLLGNSGSRAQLGIPGMIWDRLVGRSPVTAARSAVSNLFKDRSFDPREEDSTFRRIDELVSPQFQFVIAGHTHLERGLSRRHGAGRYLNTGTWAGLIQITPEMLVDDATFDPVFKALKEPTIDAINKRYRAEAAGAALDLVECRPACARIFEEDGRVKGILERVINTSTGIEFLTLVDFA